MPRPTSQCHRSSCHGPRNHGFALLITVVLLSFLVLLLVSLASLTRVETQVAANNRQLDEARQNALMALNIAIGQLQKYAGPDQRVTTTADLVADTDKTGAATPAPVFPGDSLRLTVQPGSRYWTGVWGNNQSQIAYSLPPDQIPPTTGNRRGVTPVLLNWLVSGNEKASFTAKGSSGGVNAGANITYSPESAVDLTDPDSPTIAGKAAVLLVGPHSVGASAASPQDYVAAPLVEINAPAGGVPGLGATAAPIVGHYAWWVGDEGVKARINLQNGYQKTGSASDQISSFIIAQRSAPEFMDRDPEGTASPATIDSDFDFTSALVPHIQAPSQLPLVATAAAQTDLASAVQNRFHDLTTRSYGVLSDTYAGGLKKDLTADIADASASSSYRPADATPLFTPLSAGEGYLPTWGHLRTWARTHPDGSGAITPQPASDTNAGIGPVLAYAAIGYDIRIEGSSVKVALFPVIALYNPYTVAIAPARYSVGFRFDANTCAAVETAPADPSQPGFLTISTWTQAGQIDWGVPEIRSGNVPGTESNSISFTVDGLTIPPGQSHVYYLAGNSTVYTPGQLLQRAPAGQTAVPLNYTYMPGSLTLDPSVVTSEPVENASYFRARFVGNAMGNTLKAQVTLAQEGRIDDPAGWFQSGSIVMGSSGAYPGNQLIKVTNPMAVTYDNALPLKIPGTDNWSGATQGARAAFRYCARLEGAGDFQAAERTGMPQIPMIWLRHGNVRAAYGEQTTVESSAPQGQSHLGDLIFGVVMANDNVPTRDVTLYPKPNQYALSMNVSPDAASPARYSTLFDILDNPGALLSLGQFQHVPFSRYTFYPAYPFANSMADLRVPRDTQYLSGVVPRPGTTIKDAAYDLSWHLNRALWDKYFLSSVPASFTQNDVDAGKPLPDARLTPYRANGSVPEIAALRYATGSNRAYDEAAANLLDAGAFNINSTSEQAWRAVLAGTYGIPTSSDYAADADTVDKIVPFARFSKSLQRTQDGSSPYPSVPSTMRLDVSNSTVFRNTLYHGNRGLSLGYPQDDTSDLVKELARSIVAEIRQRGPFLSLSDFVNRPLTAATEPAGIKGALQSAIDNMRTHQANPYNLWSTVAGGGLRATDNAYSGQTAYPGWDLEHYLGGSVDTVTNHPELSSFRLTYAFAPKYLTQADVLSTLGPMLSARSDTFTIRAYGEKFNPVTRQIESKAWCEAVVQRTPDFVNPGNPAQTPVTDASLTTENRNFGRKFVVVSFRWLSPSDL